MLTMGSFDLLLAGVIGIFVADRGIRWMHRRGWIQWKLRGTSGALGNAVINVQTFFQPQMREVMEVRLAEPDEREASGDPPEPGR